MFDAFKNLGNLGELMKNAKAMQDQLQNVQQEMRRKSVSADAGGGIVTATCNGAMELVKLKIDTARIDLKDVEMVEDLVVAAVGAAQAKAAEMMRQEMQKKAAEMGLPPGMLP